MSHGFLINFVELEISLFSLPMRLYYSAVIYYRFCIQKAITFHPDRAGANQINFTQRLIESIESVFYLSIYIASVEIEFSSIRC